MPFGSGPVVRQALVKATWWQRALVGAAMLATGVALVLFARLEGALLAATGVLVLWRTARHRVGRDRGAAGGDAGRWGVHR
jgi:hypothetical protein